MSTDETYPEQDAVENQDWRLHAVTAVSKDSGPHKRGTVVKAAKIFSLLSGRTLNTGAPNMDALLLDYSAKLDAETKPYIERLRTAASETTYLDDTEFFDVTEKRMASAVFAFTAIESFCNEVIAHGYSKGWEYKEQRTSGIVEVFSLERALMKVRTDEKISIALPDFLGVKSPKGTVHWQNFKRLKAIRNRIIHLKGRDRGNSRENDLWEDLFNPLGADFGRQMHAVIGYFAPKIGDLNLRWFYKFPWVRTAPTFRRPLQPGNISGT